jgi:ABC-type antimicrobial peptide transport system permease subunit
MRKYDFLLGLALTVFLSSAVAEGDLSVLPHAGNSWVFELIGIVVVLLSLCTLRTFLTLLITVPVGFSAAAKSESDSSFLITVVMTMLVGYIIALLLGKGQTE